MRRERTMTNQYMSSTPDSRLGVCAVFVVVDLLGLAYGLLETFLGLLGEDKANWGEYSPHLKPRQSPKSPPTWEKKPIHVIEAYLSY